MTTSDRSSFLVKKEKQTKKCLIPSPLDLVICESGACNSNGLQVEEGAKPPGDGRAKKSQEIGVVTLSYLSLYFQSTQHSAMYIVEVPYTFVELMHKYMTIKYILKAIFRLLEKTQILNE